MKLVIKNAGLLAAFNQVEGKEGVVQAVVLAGGTHDKVRLQALGDAAIELPVEGLAAGQSIEAGQTLMFTAKGWVDGFDYKEIKLAGKATKEEVRKGSGGSSPANVRPASNRFND